jgi:RNA polymerase sigma-70 factor (ECF subfamily)
LFQEIFSRDAPALFRYLRRLSGSRQQAEDILQETFLKLHLHLASGPGLDNPRAWLFRVGTNLSRDRAKAELRARARAQEHGAPPSPVDFQLHYERRQAVARALAQLPPRMRQVLLLKAEGFSYREIADITGIESGYVGVLLQRGRAEFKRVYEDENERTQFTARRRVR